MTGGILTGGWRKSSHSGDSGECIECATWRKSTHSGENGGECAVVAGGWRKSTRSAEHGACVECSSMSTAALVSTVLVRDTKSPAAPALAFPARAWHAFITSLK